jgi:hypothetical protein
VLGGGGVAVFELGVPGVLWSVVLVLDGVIVVLGAVELFDVPVVSVELVVLLLGCVV